MWSLPIGPPVVTIFFQGLLSSQIGAAQYTDRFEGTTGEVIRHPKAMPLLYRPFVGKELEEVDTQSRWTLQALYHWISIWWHGYEFLTQSAQQTLRWHSTKLHRSNLGQTDDMIEHASKVALAPADHDLVLFGYSRGAATTFCALAHYRYPRVRLVILESCLYSTEDNESRCSWLHSKQLALAKSTFAAAHDPLGVCPGDMLDQFPLVPVAMIGGKNDTLVHIDGQLRLAKELAARGHQVYFLILQSSGHFWIHSSSAEDKRQYLIFLHALYKKLGLPHIEALAEQGAALLELTRFN